MQIVDRNGMFVLQMRKGGEQIMIGGLLETTAGTILIIIPDPATSAAGAALVADGVRRISRNIEKK